LKKLRGVETPRFKPKLSASRLGRGLREKYQAITASGLYCFAIESRSLSSTSFFESAILQIARIIYRYHFL
jgi:hypothetical protein